MEFGTFQVEVRDGFVVAARDDRGRRWTAAGRSTLPRLLSHGLVIGAVLTPFMVTVASAQPATPGRSAARMQMLAAAETRAEHEHRVLPAPPVAAALPAAAPVAPGAPPAPPADPPRPFADAAPVRGSGGHFSFGWCTWYVSTKRYVPWMGNAIEWWPNAAAMGFPEGRTPRVGAIMVTRESGYGHVAYVEAVDADGLGWTVSEMNYRGFGVVDTRHIRMGQVPLVGFIY